MTSFLLSPGRIGTLSLRNRILMAPMGTNLCEPDGRLGPRITHYYEARARGGAALLVMGSVGVSWPRGTTNPRQIGISDDRFVPGLRALAERVQDHGSALALQIHHGGRSAVNDIAADHPLFVASRPTFKGANDRASAMSRAESEAVAAMRRGRMPIFEPASERAIEALIEDFAAAALRAREAGIDGVEVHAAHGYAIAGFLSPAWNTRTDRWGGSHEGRSRLLRETLMAIRARVGNDYPVWCRIDAREFRVEGGIDLDDAIATARAAEDAGADAVHVSAYSDSSSGIGFTDGPLVHAEEGYVEYARAIKRSLAIPVIGVGRIELERADRLIGEGAMDFVALGRKLLADPELPAKLGRARPEEIRPCIYCYRCVGEVSVGRSAFCGVNPFTGHEHERQLPPAARSRRLLVIGGGLAGMETARLAALRGHAVVLAERRSRLGDESEDAPEFDGPIARYSRWLRRQLDGLPIEVRLSTEMKVGDVKHLAPEVVVVATGAGRRKFKVPVDASISVLEPRALRTTRQIEEELGPSPATPDAARAIVLLGSGARALALADRLSRLGHSVRVLEAGETPGADIALPLRWRTLHVLRERGVQFELHVELIRIGAQTIDYRAGGGDPTAVRFDVVVDCDARESDCDSIAAVCGEIHRVGDCAGGTTVEDAVRSAFEVACAI